MKIHYGDDDPGMTEALKDFLERAGHEVLTFNTANALFLSVEDHQPDLVISDYDYGVWSGLFENGTDLLVALRAQGYTGHLLLFSGLHRPDADAAGIPQREKAGIIELRDYIDSLT